MRLLLEFRALIKLSKIEIARIFFLVRNPIVRANIAPKLSDGCPHSLANQVSLKSSQRIIVAKLNAPSKGFNEKSFLEF